MKFNYFYGLQRGSSRQKFMTGMYFFSGSQKNHSRSFMVCFFSCRYVLSGGRKNSFEFVFYIAFFHHVPLSYFNRFETRGNNMSHAETSTYCRAVGNIQFRGHAVYGVWIVSSEFWVLLTIACFVKILQSRCWWRWR